MDFQNSDQKQDSESITSPMIFTSVRENLQCAICFMYLREPVMTICGHRFCENCLSKWMNERDSRCPIDNNPLSTTDIFPDNYTKREIAGLSVVCPNDGCSVSVPVNKFEEHFDTCKFSSENMDGKEHKCSYEKLGCDFKTTDPMDLSNHQVTEAIKHTQLLLLEVSKLSSVVNNCQCSLLHNEYMADLKGKLPCYMKDVYEKLTELDQRTKEYTIEMNNKLSKCLTELNAVKFLALPKPEMTHGKLLWEIAAFDNVLNRSQSNPESEYSSTFYTSEMGYRFCMRLKLSGDNPTLGILFHLVKGSYDAILKWPFVGEITISIIHPIDSKWKTSVMKTNGSEAFLRPILDHSPIGYGFPKIATLKELHESGHIHDNKLLILGYVRPLSGE